MKETKNNNTIKEDKQYPVYDTVIKRSSCLKDDILNGEKHE